MNQFIHNPFDPENPIDTHLMPSVQQHFLRLFHNCCKEKDFQCINLLRTHAHKFGKMGDTDFNRAMNQIRKEMMQ